MKGMTCLPFTCREGGNRKRNQQSMNADQKSIETGFSIAIWWQWGDKWQSKTRFQLIFDLRSSIVLAFSIAAYLVCFRDTSDIAILYIKSWGIAVRGLNLCNILFQL